MSDQRRQVYIRFNQGRYSGSGGPGGPNRGSGGNWLSRILGLFLLLVFLGLAVTFGVFILIIGAILMIPVMWKQRHAIKQFWQLRKQAKAQFEESKRQYQQQQQRTQNENDPDIIVGEYEKMDDDNKR